MPMVPEPSASRFRPARRSAICSRLPNSRTRAAEGDHVAEAEDAKLDVFAVDLGAVGAFQIGEDDFFAVLLDLQMKAADALVVELDGVAFLTADGDGRGDIVEDATSIGTVQYPQRDQGHTRISW